IVLFMMVDPSTPLPVPWNSNPPPLPLVLSDRVTAVKLRVLPEKSTPPPSVPEPLLKNSRSIPVVNGPAASSPPPCPLTSLLEKRSLLRIRSVSLDAYSPPPLDPTLLRKVLLRIIAFVL